MPEDLTSPSSCTSFTERVYITVDSAVGQNFGEPQELKSGNFGLRSIHNLWECLRKLDRGESIRNRSKGFPLMRAMRELLIVVGIIMIIAVIYVPKLVLSKMVANEASAVTSLRKLNTACITYSTTYGGY